MIAKHPQCSTKNLIMLGSFSIDEVLPYYVPPYPRYGQNTKRTYIVNGQPYVVKMDSERYATFRNNLDCACCYLSGRLFLLERERSRIADKRNVAHFNLYGIEDGLLILMTKDHIVPRSKGGNDGHGNYQTMCTVCNNLKDNKNITLNELRKIRENARICT